MVAPTGPTLGASTLLTSSPYAVTTSWLASAGSGYTPAVADALVRVLAIDNGSGVAPATVTIGGTAVTVRATADAAHGGATSRGCFVWVGTVRGLTTGTARDVVLTTSGTTGVGKILVLVTGIVGWTGTVGGSNSALVNGTSAGGVSTSITLASTGGLLVGVGGSSNVNNGPALTAAGWNIGSSPSIGTAAGTSAVAVFASVTGGAAGSSKTLTVGADPAGASSTWVDWANAALELY